MSQMNTNSPKQSSHGYDPGKSQVSDSSLAQFLENEINSDLISVPGIGPKSAEKLNTNGISTTYQLIGTFLTLKQLEDTSQDHCDRMWHWLQSCGIDTYRSGIVQCLVEKCEIMMPSLYDNNTVFEA